MIRRTSVILSLIIIVATLTVIPARPYATTTQASPDFTIALEPSTLNVTGRSVSNVTIRLTSIGGYSSAISFNLPGRALPFLAYLPNNHPISLSADQSVTTTLIVDTNIVSPLTTGSYKFNITAASFGFSGGVLSHTAQLTVNITPGATPFTILAANTSMSVGAGSSGKMNVTVTTDNGNGIFSGNLTLVRAFDLSNDDLTDLTVTFSPNTVHLSSQNLTSTSEMQVSVAQSTLPGNYAIELWGLDGVTAYCGTTCSIITVTVTLNGPYYTVSPTSLQLLLQDELPHSENITITSVNGFSGTLTGNIAYTSTTIIVSSGYGSIRSLGLSPTSVSLGPGESKTIGALFQSVSGCQQAGPVDYTFTATNGTFTRSAEFTVSSTPYPDFTITSPTYNPTDPFYPLRPVYVKPRTSWSGNWSLTSCNGFTGPIALDTKLDPRYVTQNFVSDTTISLNPTTVSLASGQSVNSTMTVAANEDALVGGGFVNFTGTSSELFHYSAQDMSISGEFNLTSASLLSLSQGASSTVPLTVNANFARSFNFSINAPPGLTVSTSTDNATIPKGARSVSLSLTVGANSTTEPGVYNVTVTTSAPRGLIDGVYGKVYRSATVSVIVTPPSGTGPLLSPPQLAGVSAAIIIGLLGMTMLVIRRVRRPKPVQQSPATSPAPGLS